MKRIVIAGGTGLIGSMLEGKLLGLGYEVAILSRSSGNSKLGSPIYMYDSEEMLKSINGSLAVINLAGSSIAGRRWTSKYKQELYNSRIATTKVIVKAINESSAPPNKFISVSAIGYYGNRGIELLDETSKQGEGFLADLCNDWENEARKADLSTKVVIVRMGVVFSKDGGALRKLILPYKFHVGGKLGDGRQYISWISDVDTVSALVFFIESKLSADIYNVVNPNAVTMSELSTQIAKGMNRLNIFSVPQFILRLIMGEASSAVLFSQNVVPANLLRDNFKFKQTEVQEILNK